MKSTESSNKLAIIEQKIRENTTWHNKSSLIEAKGGKFHFILLKCIKNSHSLRFLKVRDSFCKMRTSDLMWSHLFQEDYWPEESNGRNIQEF